MALHNAGRGEPTPGAGKKQKLKREYGGASAIRQGGFLKSGFTKQPASFHARPRAWREKM